MEKLLSSERKQIRFNDFSPDYVNPSIPDQGLYIAAGKLRPHMPNERASVALRDKQGFLAAGHCIRTSPISIRGRSVRYRAGFDNVLCR